MIFIIDKQFIPFKQKKNNYIFTVGTCKKSNCFYPYDFPYLPSRCMYVDVTVLFLSIVRGGISLPPRLLVVERFTHRYQRCIL